MSDRILVISDLHLGAEPPMLSQKRALARFIGEIEASEGESVELVIAGDFIDFLSIKHDGAYAAYSSTREGALGRLEIALARESLVFDALKTLLSKPRCSVVVLVGNHDVELALPETQGLLASRLVTNERRNLIFVDDGRAWIRGRLLIEHGNRYDYANLNDWDGLRQTRSARSRGEAPPREIETSVGSEFVAKVLSPLKDSYPFIDLLQPQGVLVAYLMLALEPALIRDIDSIWRALRANYHAAQNRDGNRPVLDQAVSAGSETSATASPSETLFGVPEVYQELSREITGREPPAFSGAYEPWSKLRFFVHAISSDGLAARLRDGQRVDGGALRKLRAVLAKMAAGSKGRLAGIDSLDPYRKAAARMCTEIAGKRPAFDTVIMGHTHVAGVAQESASPIPYYINSGSWIDFITIPEDAMTDPPLRPAGGHATTDSPTKLEIWLRRLLDPKEHASLGDPDVRKHSLRDRDLTYVRVQLSDRGEVLAANLERWSVE